MGITAEEIMTVDPTAVTEDTSLGVALEIMQDLNIRHLPVVRGQSLVGMLSDRDIRGLGLRLVVDMESLERLEAKKSALVGAVMSSNIITVSRITEVKEIVDLMIEEKVGAVPVTEGGELIGIVSYVDVLRATRDQMD